MKQSITKWDFHDAFKNYDREDNFTYEGLNALYDYFEDYEEETGCSIELDVIAICCEYTEYEDLEEFQGQYGEDFETIEDIYNHTSVIMVNDDSFIIQYF
jgi:hypothetical protein